LAAASGGCPAGPMARANPLWFADAYFQGSGTISGSAEVMSKKFLSLPRTQQPEWMRGRDAEDVRRVVLESVDHCVRTAVFVQEYIDREVRKGRPYDDVYEEARPFIEEGCEPIKTLEEQPISPGSSAGEPGQSRADLARGVSPAAAREEERGEAAPAAIGDRDAPGPEEPRQAWSRPRLGEWDDRGPAAGPQQESRRP